MIRQTVHKGLEKRKIYNKSPPPPKDPHEKAQGAQKKNL
jgi:hypothetical protein